MYFDEKRILKQSHYNNPEPRNRPTSGSQMAQPSPSCAIDHEAGAREWKTVKMLDNANNKLQELMQLLYLLSRDPSVPNEARYHVTVAQGEIALLAHVMRTAAERECGDPLSQSESMSRQAARP